MIIENQLPRVKAEERRAALAFLEKLRDRYDVAQMIMFGSRARGDHGPDSDLDLAMVLNGRRGDFIAELPPDAGDVNMARAMAVYRDVGYDGVICVDHISQMADDVPDKKAAELQQWAYGFGYIRALIQAADEAG